MSMEIKTCTTNTDQIDREIRQLKQEKQQLERRIRQSCEAGEARELTQKLAQTERELSRKDNDAYRRQNAVVDVRI